MAARERDEMKASGVESQNGLEERTVLVLDDDTGIRVLVKSVLEPEGYSVLEAPIIQEGIELLENRSPFLVILDLHLPDGSGCSMINDIRQKVPGVSVVVVTGFADTDNMTKIVNDNVDALLMKPLDIRKLLSLVKDLSGS